MSTVKIEASSTLGIPVVDHRLFSDERGPFGIPIELDAWGNRFAELGFPLGPIRQLNYSVSHQANIRRGVHVSNAGKLVFAVEGAFTNPVIDLRDPDSATYAQMELFELVPGQVLYVPPGFGNALQNFAAGDSYCYALDGPFDPAAERVVALESFPLIQWPDFAELISDKDQAGMSLDQYSADRRRVLARARPANGGGN